MELERIESIPTLPPRPKDSHKGRFGSVLILAGSRGMAGAAALCGVSALRSGAGLVRVASPSEVQPTVASFDPCYMTYPLATDEDGGIDFEKARPTIARLIESATVVAVGPGLGQSESIRALVRFLLEETNRPLVIDADALNVLAGHLDLLSSLSRPVVLTPHPGEFARLAGLDVPAVQADREAQAVALARKSESLVVALKGAQTIVTDGERIYVNTTGNAGMATGGSGDVPTGIVAALLAQRAPAFEAAQLGVYVHGIAGDIARDHDGEIGMIAGDIVDALPDAFVHLN